MSSDRAKRIATIVDEALAVPESDRAAHIRSACKGDEQLAAEVADLISYRSKAEDPEFVLAETRLRSPDMPASQRATVDLGEHPKPNRESIGPYRIVRVLGEGGMGIVYEAEQSEPVRRSVALKVIKPGMDSKAIIARFEAERQALAMMSHSGVAKVLDGGQTPDGRPFFAMELVKGLPITEHSDRHRLALHDRLHLLASTCDAVQHAHSKGVIHRDLKPSNVLVAYEDGVAQPRVIDFGIAKALNQQLTDSTLHTAFGQLIGTPEYMSPEQAEMGAQDIDTRSDVYALGILMYELLTGARPIRFDHGTGSGLSELQRLIRDTIPLRPSTRLSTGDDNGIDALKVAEMRATDVGSLTRLLRRDLDWIAMKCLEKDRERRYPTASALAADIRSYLTGQPVSAGPPTVTYKLSKFVSRNRTAVALSAAVLLSLVGGLGGTSYGLLAASHRAEEREHARAELEQVAGFQATRLSAVDARAMGDGIRDDIESNLDAESGRAASDSLAGVNFTDIALGALDRSVLTPSESAIDREFGAQPEVRARLLQSLAQTRRELGLLDTAEGVQREAVRVRLETLGDRHPDTLASIMQLGQLLRTKGDLAGAEQQLRIAVEGLAEVAGDSDRETLNAMNSLAFVVSSLGRREEAEPIYRRVLEACGRTLGETHTDTLATKNNLASVVHDLGRFDEAESLYLEVLETRRQVFGDDHPETQISRNNLGFLYMDTESFDKAEQMLTRALDGSRRHYGNHHEHTITSLSVMGGLMWQTARYEDAEAYWDEALRSAHGALGERHPLTLDAENNMGLLRRSQERFSEAEEYFRTTYQGRREVLGPNATQTFTSLARLASTLISQGRYAEAEPLCTDNEQRRRSVFGAGSRPHRLAAAQLAGLYEQWNAADPSDERAALAAEWRAVANGP